MIANKNPYISAGGGVNFISKGSNILGGLYPGFFSGSGNYVSFEIPCRYDDSITSCSVSNGGDSGSFVVYGPEGNVGANEIDFTYCAITKKKTGIQIEMKFTSTKLKQRVATVAVADAITFTFS